MGEFAIRPAVDFEGPVLGDIFVAARRVALPFLREPHSPAEMRAWICDVVVPRQTTWVAERGGQIAGFMTLDGEEVEHLYLDPDMTRSGIGSALIAFAKAQSPGRLVLTCFAQNQPARRFYEAHGFHAVSFGDGTGNEESAPDVVYEWRGGG
ncbi:MAG: GNAT family N-acetyltransferase [Pseudomonadota bacterium]